MSDLHVTYQQGVLAFWTSEGIILGVRIRPEQASIAKVEAIKCSVMNRCVQLGVSAADAEELVHCGLNLLFETAAEFDLPTSREREPLKISLPPGARLARVLRVVLTPRAFRTRVQTPIAEMQGEYIEELAQGHVWQARWVAVRGHFLVVWPFLCALVPAFVRRMFTVGPQS